ncbi:NADH-quinone oxidoreductase subunit C [Balneolales bacterium ANBcel1]|nr:NADH-quinone oxidoreductase subunit C [Balneolales bacterium ANBcel1]
MDATIKEAILQKVRDRLGNDLHLVYEEYAYPLLRINQEVLHDTCRFFKEELHFSYLNDVFATDRFTSEDRFEVIYHLISLREQQRFFLKVYVDEENPVLPTVTDLWNSANWNEREVYDMFGIRFDGHPDLRRIFLPEDFKYFPLRKEFPLLGVPGSIELPSSTPDHD